MIASAHSPSKKRKKIALVSSLDLSGTFPGPNHENELDLACAVVAGGFQDSITSWCEPNDLVAPFMMLHLTLWYMSDHCQGCLV
jgi:hypothetical protein